MPRKHDQQSLMLEMVYAGALNLSDIVPFETIGDNRYVFALRTEISLGMLVILGWGEMLHSWNISLKI